MGSPQVIKDEQHEIIEFIFRYHKPGYMDTMVRMGDVREIMADAAHKLIDICPDSPEFNRVVEPGGLLDRAVMLCIASLARHEPDTGGRPNTVSHPSPVQCSCGDPKAPGFNHRAEGMGPCLPREGR